MLKYFKFCVTIMASSLLFALAVPSSVAAEPVQATPKLTSVSSAISPPLMDGGTDVILSAQLETAYSTVSAVKPTQPWSHILTTFGQKAEVTLFDYQALSSSAPATDMLQIYIEDLAAQTPSTMPRDEAMAYWANLYNALTVQVVAQNWPVKSIKEIKSGVFTAGPWKRDLVKVEGEMLSLDDIEHGILRKDFTDPRIHYMVNCASIGCPNLRLEEWRAQGLEEGLDRAAREFINSSRGARVEDGKLVVSSIYKWFKEDFGGNDSGVIAHLKQYADAELAQQLTALTKVSTYEYDWSVNAP